MKLSYQATMFGDVPLADKFQLAHAAGFEGIARISRESLRTMGL